MNEPKQKRLQKYRLWHTHYFAHIAKYKASENELLHNRRKNCRANQLNYKSACIKALDVYKRQAIADSTDIIATVVTNTGM